jgi:hypothetical protein
MGPINLHWYEERGLLEDDGVTPTIRYSAGRIDIRDNTKEGYAGWDEYSVAPMHDEDWYALSDYLEELTTEELLSYNKLIEQFETHYGKRIRWADEQRTE